MAERTGQPTSETTGRQSADRQSVETIERVAGVLAQLSSELTEISARLRSQTEATERDDPGREAANRTREPLSGSRQRIPVGRGPTEPSRKQARPELARPEAARLGTDQPEIALGEPVDTSFAPPARVPTASAVGTAPGRRFRLLAGFGGSVGLLGLVVVVTVALTRGWYAPLGQVLAGALLGVALFAGALWLHHKSTGRPL